MGAALTASIGRAAAQTGRATPVHILIGLALMLWASRSVLKAFRLISAIAWGEHPSSLGISFGATLATSAVLTLLSIYGAAVEPLYRGSIATDIGSAVLSTAGISAIATWVAGVLPHPVDVRWQALIPSAILFAVGIQALRLATAMYFVGRLARVDDLYGALGFAAVFMTYLYFVARLAVLGLLPTPRRSILACYTRVKGRSHEGHLLCEPSPIWRRISRGSATTSAAT
jgi:uncharacterized BrkB/YihY/UPF0761 family membrane protein